ncbi:MAG TPA: efflux RND transporter periplasmic adaptor subunit [Gammaproteobacteria bacterium]|nr:efflux RND transporter periplasmic adaptor subunit [Gammaproteobacteria bacterium]
MNPHPARTPRRVGTYYVPTRLPYGHVKLRVGMKAMPTLLFCILLLLFSAASQAAEPVPVEARPFAELAVYPEYRAPASVISDNNSRISAEVSARIQSIPVQVGDVVEKDAVLVRLAPEDLQLAVAREETALQALQVRLELADYQLSRARALSRKKVVAEELLKQREAELRTLRAQLEGQKITLALARRQLAKATIHAPFDASIGARLAQEGELASPGSPLLQIIDRRRVEVSAQLQAQPARSLQQAKQVELVTEQGHYLLRLRTIAPNFDPQTRTREARLGFRDTEKSTTALPGSAGELVWRDPQPRLPAELLIRREGQLGVFVIDENAGGIRARFIPLPDAEEGRPAATGLTPQTRVITLGRFRLRDGDTVSVGQ